MIQQQLHQQSNTLTYSDAVKLPIQVNNRKMFDHSKENVRIF